MNMTKNNRCTFAIISHPDAGKTTMTEKIIFHGNVIRETGMVKSKKGQYAKSDWMDLEKQRGISISSSVLSFEYGNRSIHLLDTPGHKDFSEDTYRTLTAVESALMMIDSAKGVETQTRKLMEVCRLRDTPIITFMNKFDRDAMNPYELIDNVESICKIQCCPMNWPIGDGVNFKGIYDIYAKEILLFSPNKENFEIRIIKAEDLESEEIIEICGKDNIIKLQEDLELVQGVLPKFDKKDFFKGMQTPVFFGSALYSFGVRNLVNFISDNAPLPLPREALKPPFDENAEKLEIPVDKKEFSGFIFKIQANMDKNHRDRMAFLRVCSGTFRKGAKVFNTRTNKEIKISSPVFFQAQDREIVELAIPGDIIGIHDNGKLQIGDTFTEGSKIKFSGIPNFAPEIFRTVILKDPLKAKQLEKGLNQLSEEGTVQLFKKKTTNEKILGAVGVLQFEVVQYRLENEYGVRAIYEGHIFSGIRWLKFPTDKVRDQFIDNYSNVISYDHKKRLCFGVKSDWDLKLAMEKNPDVQFFVNSDYIN
jgi:peptide chain release factor 3